MRKPPPISRKVYLALRRQARNERRGTQELFEFYLLERFLYRLSVSKYRDRFVLKGGLLLTVLGVRRPTRDADVLARNIAGDDETLLTVVKEVARIPVDDGITFDTSQARATTIREHAAYPGTRDRRPGHVRHGAASTPSGREFRGPSRSARDNVPESTLR